MQSSTKEWVPIIDGGAASANLAKYVEHIELCRRCIELLFPAELRAHAIVFAAADAQMRTPGVFSYEWVAAQLALGVRQ